MTPIPKQKGLCLSSAALLSSGSKHSLHRMSISVLYVLVLLYSTTAMLLQ